MHLRTARFLLLGAMAAAPPLMAADPEEGDEPADLVANAKRFYGIGREEGDCETDTVDGAIVVCARRKVSPRIERTEPTERRDGKMMALGSSGVGHGTGGGVSMRICFLQKCPKDLYFFDIAALPEPAPGTDADKIAKGL